MSSYKRIVLYFLSVYSTCAFSPAPSSNTRDRLFGRTTHSRNCMSSALGVATTDTSLFFKDHPDEEYTTFSTSTATVHNPAKRVVEPAPSLQHPEFYLPRHSDERARKARVLMGETELLVGRIAMIAALLLFGVELVTGASLPDQLVRYFG